MFELPKVIKKKVLAHEIPFRNVSFLSLQANVIGMLEYEQWSCHITTNQYNNKAIFYFRDEEDKSGLTLKVEYCLSKYKRFLETNLQEELEYATVLYERNQRFKPRIHIDDIPKNQIESTVKESLDNYTVEELLDKVLELQEKQKPVIKRKKKLDTQSIVVLLDDYRKLKGGSNDQNKCSTSTRTDRQTFSSRI